MNRPEDPRLIVTREVALNAALEILANSGVLAVSHGAVSKATGIARSTLYRHWPSVSQLRNDAFKRAARSSIIVPENKGRLREDLFRLLSFLVAALNESAWGKIVPQVVAAAATDEEAKDVINQFMRERMDGVEALFRAAIERGELPETAPVQHLVELAVAVPYFRKLIAGLPLDQVWLEDHVARICALAVHPNDGPLSAHQFQET